MQKGYLVAVFLLLAGETRSEESWLNAEIRAQEERWAAQQDKTPILRPVVSPSPSLSVRQRPKLTREGSVSFPALAAIRSPNLVFQGQYGLPSETTAPLGQEGTEHHLGNYSDFIIAAAAQHQVDPLLIRAVILTESSGKRGARSPKGAMGLMQLMPATAARFGVSNAYDPAQNIAGGARYLRWLLDYFGGNVRLALAGYNAGEGAVNKYGGIPPYKETQSYVQRVQDFHRILQLASTYSNR